MSPNKKKKGKNNEQKKRENQTAALKIVHVCGKDMSAWIERYIFWGVGGGWFWKLINLNDTQQEIE